jgi:hypothetical protein
MPGYIFHITENLKVGIDFYGISVAQTGIALSGDLSSSTSATRIRTVAASINLTSDLIISGTEYQYLSVNINANASVTTVGTKTGFTASAISIDSSANISSFEIALASVATTSDTSVTVSAIEILKAESTVSGDLSTTVVGQTIKKAATSINSSLTASGVGTEIVKAAVSINGMLTTVSVGKEISFLQVSINALTPSLFVNLIRFRANGSIDTSNYQTLFVIDGNPLTNQGRTFSSDLSQVIVENKNWNNKKSRHYKRSGSAGRKTFTLAWTYLPNSRQDTIDRRHARDFLKGIANDPDVHTLKMINDDSNNTTPYTETQYQVFIRDYSETLLRRDLINGVYYWDCNMTLEEV